MNRQSVCSLQRKLRPAQKGVRLIIAKLLDVADGIDTPRKAVVKFDYWSLSVGTFVDEALELLAAEYDMRCAEHKG